MFRQRVTNYLGKGPERGNSEKKEEAIPRTGDSNRKLETVEKMKLESKFFQKLKKVCLAVFLEKTIYDEDLDLEEYEKKILRILLKKKGFAMPQPWGGDSESLNLLLSESTPKKKEYCLKMVLVKCIKHLKKEFQRQYHSDLCSQNDRQELESLFYKYHFEEISEQMQIPIERFFAFKNWTHRFDDYIPKSITSKLLRLWKKNPRFIGAIEEYLKGNFLSDFIIFNQQKIERMVKEWEKAVKKDSLENVVKSIVKRFKEKKSKLPWTLSEVKAAIKVTLDVLKD